MTENSIARDIVDLSIYIHTGLGPGLFESVYEEILSYELIQRGYFIQRQLGLPVYWNGVKMDLGFRADLIVENKVIVEIKSIEALAPVHKKQVITYLKIQKLKLGLLINFNENLVKDGISRIVNGL